MTTINLTLDDETVTQIAVRVAETLGRPVEGWMNVDQAAAHLACPTSRIYDLVSDGSLMVRRDGRRLLFRCAWLDAVVT